MIYTTNAIEWVNARIRKAVKARGSFPERAGGHQVRVHGGWEEGAPATEQGRHLVKN